MREPTLSSTCGKRRRAGIMAGMGVLLFALMLVATQAQAIIVNTGNPDLYVRFDNTITYSAVARILDQDPDLLANPNEDDGNRNFDKGLVMNRVDLLSQFDVSYKRVGFRVTGAGWYDTVYNQKNDNDSPQTANAVSVPYNEFTEETRDLHGRDVELLEAFTWGAIDLGETTFRYRAGQFTQWWGESYWMGYNGVAGALAPVDVAKAATLPNVQLEELIRPIPQVSGSIQVSSGLSFAGYYQFKWEPTRLFASGSYFSPADVIGDGVERLLGPGFLKTDNLEPPDSGQFGLNAKLETQFATWQAYYNKFHAKDFYVVVQPIDRAFSSFYPEDIEQFAVSANKTVGIFNFATEVTYRKNVPFRTLSSALAIFPDFGPFVNMPHTPTYARGETLSVLLNSANGNMPPNFFCDSQDLNFEIGWVKQMKVTDYEEYLDPAYDETGLQARFAYVPKWFQVMPGIDIKLPMGATYSFQGKPTTLLWSGQHQGGSFNFGIAATYVQRWDAGLTYTNFYGSTNYQDHADRDYISFFIRRAF